MHQLGWQCGLQWSDLLYLVMVMDTLRHLPIDGADIDESIITSCKLHDFELYRIRLARHLS